MDYTIKRNETERINMELNRFEAFISETIRWETGGDKTGAYTNDPHDAGGETKWGISKNAHPEVDIKNLTYKQAVEIYKEEYYNPYFDLIMSENIAFKVYDMGVLNGPRTAMKMLQRTIRKASGLTIKIDGRLGPLTLTALSMAIVMVGERQLYEAYVKRILARINRIVALKPWNIKYRKGWINRAIFLLKPFKEEKNEKS